MNHAQIGDVELAYETFGDAEHPAVLLIMGLGTQMLAWHEDFCEALAAERRFVVRYDNRDIGLSTHLHDAPIPDVMAAMAGDLSAASYTLADMAGDAIGLLDALGIERAHLVGASMGGMIAQTAAIEHPDRVLSLTSIMSTTGEPSVGTPTPAAIGVLLASAAQGREAVIEQTLATLRVIGSPGYELDEAMVIERAGISFDRAHDPLGVGRQLLAILASGDRTERLRGLDLPVLVIHGSDDALISVSGGRATAAAIPGAELVVIDGMGHDLPRALWPQLITAISAVTKRASPAPAG